MLFILFSCSIAILGNCGKSKLELRNIFLSLVQRACQQEQNTDTNTARAFFLRNLKRVPLANRSTGFGIAVLGDPGKAKLEIRNNSSDWPFISARTSRVMYSTR